MSVGRNRVRTEVYLFARHDADGRFGEIRGATVTLPADADADADADVDGASL